MHETDHKLKISLGTPPEVLPGLLDRDPRLELLSSGFSFTEGALWDTGARCLYFSDIPKSQIWVWTRETGARVWREPSHMANGLTLDDVGRMLICEHETSRLTRLQPGEAPEILADTYRGTPLNSPNDVIVARDGTIYFTDPTYGREPFWGVERPADLDFRGVFAISAGDGTLHCLADDFDGPNGLCLSQDERQLFVNDSERNHIRRLDLETPLSVKDSQIWAKLPYMGEGSADGMKRDNADRLWCCGPGGVHVFSAEGAWLGLLHMPEFTANLCFGGDDRRELFLTASTRIWRLQLSFSA